MAAYDAETFGHHTGQMVQITVTVQPERLCETCCSSQQLLLWQFRLYARVCPSVLALADQYL